MGCNVLCCKKDRRRGPCNEVRFIEFFLCLLCLSCAIVASTLGHIDRSIHWFFAPLYTVPICYIFITFVDIIATWTYFPIGWRAWILFAVGGGLLFFFCCGLSPLLLTELFFLYTLLYILTALVFLMDGLCIVWMIRSLRLGQDSGRPQPCCNVLCGNKSTQIAPQMEISDSITQTDPNYHQQRDPSVGDHPQRCGIEKYRKRAIYQESEDLNMRGEPCDLKQDCESFSVENERKSEEKIKEISKLALKAQRIRKEVDLTPLKNPFLVKNQFQ